MSNTTVTTQSTSKVLKFNTAIAYFLLLVGLVMIASHDAPTDDNHTLVWGCLISLYALAHLGVTRLRIWWNHK